MNFCIAHTFTDSLAKLTGEEQKSVKTTAEMIYDSANAQHTQGTDPRGQTPGGQTPCVVRGVGCGGVCVGGG